MSEAIAWFPNVRRGLPRIVPLAVEPMIAAAWKLAIEIRAIAEDLEGAEAQPMVVRILAIKLVEALTDIDLQLAGWASIDEEHLLPLALDAGWGEIARCDGATIARCFELQSAAPDAAALRSICDAVIAAFPGRVPDPLVQDGQGPILRALRSWSKLCRAVNVQEDFLVPLVRDV